MVHCVVCNLHLGRLGLCPRDIRCAAGCWRSHHSGVVLVDRLVHGSRHRQLCGRVGVGISHAGGMYFVTKHVVPPDQVPIFSWIQGWCNLLGQTAGVSSVAYTVSQMLLACISMNSDLVDGEYMYSPYGDYHPLWGLTQD